MAQAAPGSRGGLKKENYRRRAAVVKQFVNAAVAIFPFALFRPCDG